MRASKSKKSKDPTPSLGIANKENLKAFVRAAIAPALYTLVFALMWLKPRLYDLYYGNLDPSYILGVQKAAEMHESFGPEFTSNYGPLSYSVINFLPEKVIGMSLWHIAVVIAVGVGAYIFGKLYVGGSRLRQVFATLLLLFTLALASPEWLYLDLFILYAFIYLKLPETSAYKKRLLIGLTLLSVLYMLTKFTIGLVSIGGLAIIILSENGLTKEAIKARLRPLARLLLLYGSVLVVLAYALGTTNIFAYFTSGLEVASGFSGIMGISDPNLALATKYLLIMFSAVVVWLIVRFRTEYKYYLFLLPILFIVMKYAITRQDGHVLVILQVVFFLVALLYFVKPKVRAADLLFVGFIVAFAFLGMWANYTEFRLFHRSIAGPITNVVDKQAVHFLRPGAQKANWNKTSQPNLALAELPESMRQKIGDQSVDIFPWETVIADVNNLQWHHRPSPYSFETYTEKLDKMNEEFIRENGPQFIIWHKFDLSGTLSIDGRHVLWDGPRTVRAVMQHYQLSEAGERFLLLERRQEPMVTAESQVLSEAKGHDWVRVPESAELVCAHVAINNSPIQALTKILIRERPFFIDAQYTDGTVRTYRFTKDTSEGGLVVSALPYTWDQMIAFFKGETAASSDTVTQIRVRDEDSAKITFKPCNE